MNAMNFIQQFTIWALPVLFAITLHEVAHGWVASKLGDKTALMLGRLSLNPINHVDLFGTIIVPGILLMAGGILFGWAKPVPVNWNNLKNPRRDMALVAIAGPMANLLMTFFWAAVAKLGLALHINDSTSQALYLMGMAGVNINLLLMVFNLLPLPPLDGSKLVSSLLSSKLAWNYNRLEPYGFIILLLLLFAGVLNYVVMPIMTILVLVFLYLFNLPFS